MPNITISISGTDGTTTQGSGNITDQATVDSALTVLAALTDKASSAPTA